MEDYEESGPEMIDRLKLMAAGDPQWDLSDNDRVAIGWILNERELLRERLKDMAA